MSIRELILPRAGRWTGENQLWMDPSAPAVTSPSTLTISGAARDHVVRVDYEWAFEGKPQVGTLLFGFERETSKVTCAFADSWHMSEGLMLCGGTMDPAARTVSVKGTYGDGQGGPRWGWRISLELGDESKLALVMHNITPDGDEHLAVRAEHVRAS
jgi:hypothetical protein